MQGGKNFHSMLSSFLFRVFGLPFRPDRTIVFPTPDLRLFVSW